jgi:hypothetical protein
MKKNDYFSLFIGFNLVGECICPKANDCQTTFFIVAERLYRRNSKAANDIFNLSEIG